jgi:hypothetical protein
MPQSPFLSTDPNAAQVSAPAASPFLSTDPNAATVTPLAATPPPQDSALSRFGAGFLRTNPVSTGINLASSLWEKGLGQTAEDVVVAPANREWDLAKQAYGQGRPLAALGHAVGSIPLVGPALASPVERARTGDVAGAAGEAVGTASTLGLAKPAVAGVGGTAADVGRAIPGVSDVMESAGERANRFSTRKMTQAIAPPSGPNKANLTAVAQRIAPQLARSPELAGVATHGGLVSAIENGLDSARDGLDQVNDPALLQSMHPTQPIINGLMAEQGKLMVRGSAGAVVPPERMQAYNHLQSMIDTVKSMGTSADYENLRNLRQSWDQVAASSKIYAKTAAEFEEKTKGQTYANGASVMREHLSSASPAAADANARYSLFANAKKVMDAAEQATVTSSPGVGQSLVTRGLGILAGKETGLGIPAEIIGAMVAPVLDRGLSAVKTGVKIKIAQNFANLADALTGKNPSTIAQRVQELKAAMGPIKTPVRLGLNAGQFAGQDQQEQQPAATPPPGPQPAATPPPR